MLIREKKMARKRNSSAFEDIFEIAALLPWWVGCALAVVSYLVLHRYAAAVVSATAPGQLVVGTVTKTLASIGQVVIPLVLMAGSLASFLGRRKRAGLLEEATGDKSGESLRSMSWRDFEMLVGESFRTRGFAVEETGGGGADGGIDLKLRKGNEVFLVQCKQWRAYKVSVTVVRELFGVMAAQGATGGFVVTSGIFTADAKEFAKGRNIELIDGSTLAKLIGAVSNHRPPERAGQAVRSTSSPACPTCGSEMIKRTAKQGANAGGEFWGCSQFPKCRGVRSFG